MIFRLNFTPGDKRTCPEKGMRLPVASPLQSVHQLAVACMCVLYVGGELYAQFSPHTCVRSYSTVSYNYCCLWCLRQLSSRYQYRYIHTLSAVETKYHYVLKQSDHFVVLFYINGPYIKYLG